MLHGIIAQHVAVKDIRLVRDKFTGAPRGFCFVQFHSVADAAKALQLLQVWCRVKPFLLVCFGHVAVALQL
jgi:RNA recognition motif-containing protein